MYSGETLYGTIKENFVDYGSYFVINRERQYGKTTTLRALEEYLKKEYFVASLDFQELGTEEFADAQTFTRAFADIFVRAFKLTELGGMKELLEPVAEICERHDIGLKDLFVRLGSLCENSPCPIVLMIDEVDSAGNNQVFIEFLALLRKYYLKRDKAPIFHAVILAGVYDIKNLKLKLRPDSEHQYNSPWNIAADFDIDMSFSVTQIAEMLEEYEADNQTRMNIQAVAEEIYQYTSGYPVLVSSICKQLDEKIIETEGFETMQKTWTEEGIEKAVRNILKKSSPLFESMTKQLDVFGDLYKIVEDIIYCGKKIPFSLEVKSISLGNMFGFLKEENGHVAIANRMFEMCLLNMFMAKEAINSDVYAQGGSDRSGFIKDNMLDMTLVLKKFVEYFTEIYGQKYERRTDIIVDYLGEQFIIELKIWHGSEYNERGEKQLTDYLNYYHKDKGYMLSFNFNKNKETGVNEIRIGNKVVVEAVV